MSDNVVEVWLYGKLRRFAAEAAPDAQSVVRFPLDDADTIGTVLTHIGISPTETSNIFLNGELSGFSREVKPGDRLGVFPHDMCVLYKWYFQKEG
jgi:hypothetical protein